MSDTGASVALTVSSSTGSATSDADASDSANACATKSAILDGTFFSINSVGKDGSIKASCSACPDGKKALCGAVGSTTNFLNHLKVLEHS